MGLWLLVTALTFSLMQGIFHEYYVVALAPAIAALVGMGTGEAWERRSRLSGAVVLSAASATTAIWSFVLLGRTEAYGDWLRFGVLALGCTAAGLLLLVARLPRRLATLAAVAAVLAGLAGPAAYSATTLATAHSGSIVTAGPATGHGPGGMPGGGAPRGMPAGGAPGGMPGGGAPGGMPGGAPGGMPGGAPGGAPGGSTGALQGGPSTGGAPGGGMRGLLDATTPSAAVVSALQADAGSFTWVAAAVGSQNAAGLQLASEQPVMAIGGFNGSDPSPTLAQFKEHVAQGRIHYFLQSSGFGQQNGGSSAASDISSWVTQTFTKVTIGGQTLYDLTQPVGGASS